MRDTATPEPGEGPGEGDDVSISPARTSGDSIAVSVIIPCFQAEATLARAVQSVLGQTMRDIEIIVADDGSTDLSLRQIADWLPREPRLRVLRKRRNCGKSAVMNSAVPFARGRWLAILDADDWYHPDRLTALVTIGERSGAELVADNQFFYDAVAQTVVGLAWPRGDTDWELSFDDFLLGSNVYDAFNFGMLKPVLRTEFVRSSRLSYDERARHGQDFFYLLEFFLLGGKAAIADTPYYFYTQPFGAISRRWSHTARRRYDFQMAHDINQGYLRVDAANLTPHQSRRLKARSRRLAALESYFRAKELWARGEWRSLIRQLIEHPMTLDCTIRRLFGRCCARSAAPTAARIAQASRRRSRDGFGG